MGLLAADIVVADYLREPIEYGGSVTSLRLVQGGADVSSIGRVTPLQAFLQLPDGLGIPKPCSRSVSMSPSKYETFNGRSEATPKYIVEGI